MAEERNICGRWGTAFLKNEKRTPFEVYCNAKPGHEHETCTYTNHAGVVYVLNLW